MLPATTVIVIRNVLIANGLFPFQSTLPSTWPDLFYEYGTSELDEVHAKTNVTKEDLVLFFNQTVPCMWNVLNETAAENITNPHTVGTEIWKDCFHEKAQPAKTIASSCTLHDLTAAGRGIMYITSFCFILFLTLFCRRRKRLCVSCCGGKPGPVVPLNMLDSYENRKGIAMAFGVGVLMCISVLFNDYNSLVGSATAESYRALPSYLSILLKITFTVMVSMTTYPFFVCQAMHNKFIGSIVGICLCLLWLGIDAFQLYVLCATCLEYYKERSQEGVVWLSYLVNLPRVVCIILLLIKFIRVLVIVVIRRRTANKKGHNASWLDDDDTDWKEEYIYRYVKSLFVVRVEEDENSMVSLTFKEKMRAKLYTNRPGFRYSTRVVAATVVSSCAVFILSLLIIQIGYALFALTLDDLLNSDAITEIEKALNLPEGYLKRIGQCVQASFWLGMIFAIAFYILVTMNSLTWYRRHIIKLRKGDRSFLPNSVDKGSLDAGGLMLASLRFAGYQVGYCVWGFIIMFVIGTVLFIVISTQIFLPMIEGELSILLSLLIRIWPSILIGIALSLLQKLIASKCFLIDKDTLAVDNRRAYHIFSYFMFYFNIFIGLVSCLLRILFGMICGAVFLQRLQKSSLPRSYERRDPGYVTYLGYILLENQHANPVLQCFVRLLLETQDLQMYDDDDEVKSPVLQVKISSASDYEFAQKSRNTYRQKRAQNRWHLFVMLIRNPSLKKYRIRDFIVKKKNVIQGLFCFSNFDELDNEQKVTIMDELPERLAGNETDTLQNKNEEKTNILQNEIEHVVQEKNDEETDTLQKGSDSVVVDLQNGNVPHNEIEHCSSPRTICVEASDNLAFTEDEVEEGNHASDALARSESIVSSQLDATEMKTLI